MPTHKRERVLELLAPELNDQVSLVFSALLIDRCNSTLIPELIDIFGVEYAIKFIELFSGTTITIPKKSLIEEIVRDATVFVALQKSDLNKEVLKELQTKYNLNTTQVAQILKSTSKSLKEL